MTPYTNTLQLGALAVKGQMHAFTLPPPDYAGSVLGLQLSYESGSLYTPLGWSSLTRGELEKEAGIAIRQLALPHNLVDLTDALCMLVTSLTGIIP